MEEAWRCICIVYVLRGDWGPPLVCMVIFYMVPGPCGCDKILRVLSNIYNMWKFYLIIRQFAQYICFFSWGEIRLSTLYSQISKAKTQSHFSFTPCSLLFRSERHNIYNIQNFSALWDLYLASAWARWLRSPKVLLCSKII